MFFGALLAAALAANVISGFNGSSQYQSQMASLRGLPAEVRAFIDRRANCNHWFGEEPYDQERKSQIRIAIKDLRCDDLTKVEAGLKSRYRRNQSVLNALELSQDWTPG
jgi:hypothetical protein